MINKADKPPTYISTGDVAGLQMARYKGIRVRVRVTFRVRFRL